MLYQQYHNVVRLLPRRGTARTTLWYFPYQIPAHFLVLIVFPCLVLASCSVQGAFVFIPLLIIYIICRNSDNHNNIIMPGKSGFSFLQT